MHISTCLFFSEDNIRPPALTLKLLFMMLNRSMKHFHLLYLRATMFDLLF